MQRFRDVLRNVKVTLGLANYEQNQLTKKLKNLPDPEISL